MTVSQTEITAILQRLTRVEERQNLLKDNLLNLKKQVSSLQHAFQDRPELPQIEALQEQLNQLAEFAARPMAATTPEGFYANSTLVAESGMDTDMVDADILVMPLLEEEEDFSEILTGGDDSDLSGLLNLISEDGDDALDVSMLDLNDLDSMESLSVDELSLEDVPMDVATDFETLDLDQFSLADLDRLDFSVLSGVGAIDASLGMEDLGGFVESSLDLQGDLQDVSGIDVDALSDPLDLEMSSGQDEAGLMDSQVTDYGMDSFESADFFAETGGDGDPDFLHVESLAPETIDLGGLDGLSELDSGLDVALDLEESLPLMTAIAPEAGDVDGVADLGSGEANLELVTGLEGLEFEAIAAVDPLPFHGEEVLTDLDFPPDVDPGEGAIGEIETAAWTYFTEPDVPPEAMPALTLDNEMGELNLDMTDLELELAAALPEYDALTVIDPSADPQPIMADVSVTMPPVLTEYVGDRQPMVDTEDPEDLAPVLTPPSAIESPPPELTPAEVLTRIENRQHYFIGFRLPHIQLARQNLRDCIFDKSDLQNSEFHNADLRDCSFRESNLQNANLEYASLERANFEQANLQNVNFQGILFNRRTNFKGANLQGADFSYLNLTEPPDCKQADLSHAYFLECNLRGADLSQWNLTGAKLCRANLLETNLRNAILTDADLRGAVYNHKTTFPDGFHPQGAILLEPGADLSNEDLQGLDLTSLDLTRVNFSGANLEQTKLDYCDLSEANFYGANLRRAELKVTALEINLENANLTQADLTEGNFTGSNCKQANFQSAVLKNANFTMTDLRGANLKGANTYRMNCNGSNMEEIDLREINFEGNLSGANLSRAQLQNLNLNYLNLSWANLTGADLTGVSFKEANLDNANLTDAVGFRTVDHDYTIYLNNTVLPDGSTWD